MSAADPTLKILRDLENPHLYLKVSGVPVFDEHEEPYFDAEIGPDGKPVKDKDGNPKGKWKVLKFHKPELEYIAHHNNERTRNTGSMAAITLGHTLSKASEQDQPKPVGYVKDYQVGHFGPNKKLGLLANFYIKQEHADEARTYPHRSIELYPTDFLIDPVSLLRRTPQRDLGVLTFNRRNAISRNLTPYRPKSDTVLQYERRTGRLLYVLPEEGNPMPDEPMDKPPMGDEPPMAKPAPAPMPEEEEDELPEEHKDMAQRYAKHLFGGIPHQHLPKLMGHLHKKYGKEAGCEEMGEKPAKYDADGGGMGGGGAPSGTNTFVPDMEGGGKPEQYQRHKEMTEAMQNQRRDEELKLAYARIEALEAKNAETAKQAEEADVDSHITTLVASGIDLTTDPEDYKQVKGELLRRSGPERITYARWLQKNMVKNGRPAPMRLLDVSDSPSATDTPQPDGPRNETEVMALWRYQKAKEIGADEAMEAFRKDRESIVRRYGRVEAS